MRKLVARNSSKLKTNTFFLLKPSVLMQGFELLAYEATADPPITAQQCSLYCPELLIKQRSSEV